MRDWRCAERGRVAAQEGRELRFEALDAGLGCCCLGCGGSRLAGFGRLGPEEIGAWALLPDSGERAWEHDDCGFDVETVRVDVGLVEMTIGIGDGWRTTCEVGFVLAGVCLPTYVYFAVGNNTIDHQCKYPIKRVGAFGVWTKPSLMD